ncbi:ABC transporter ATP-binding protein [Nonomuraea endophytica]|uniref:Peptide/nickel transport system ATP-binding protein n=1 Tax=Nonomuraea endophytica TaxID=714136 RepID=A0A7W8AAA2_9ACTN|nr:ABC transporter ATP-binding protein [Nonomuraea endophytica]MBB5081501.1 peptide/nickel transport system ATP-binding protein [Nonomuraea endophytica]
MRSLTLREITVRLDAGRRAFTALDRVSLHVARGSVVGLVGESGSGKSTLGRAVVGLAPLTSGRVLLDGQDVTPGRRRRRSGPGLGIQMVLQDSYSALDPQLTIGRTLDEARQAALLRPATLAAQSAGELLELVGLDHALAAVRPGTLSGGQRQRVALARALASRPEVLILDEVTSALDASVQSAIINLLRDLRGTLGLTMLVIGHNLAAVRHLADSVAVMYAGQIVETAPTERLIGDPRHPYTKALLGAVPRLNGSVSPGAPDPDGANSPGKLPGEPPDPHVPLPGCRFHPQCPVGPLAVPDRTICTTHDPRTDARLRPHQTACHFAA